MENILSMGDSISVSVIRASHPENYSLIFLIIGGLCLITLIYFLFKDGKREVIE